MLQDSVWLFTFSRSVLNKLQVLIIDKDRKDKNDRTWGFWTRHQTVFDSVITSRFSKLALHSSHHSKIYDLQDYHYNVIRGIDFYRFIKEQLAKLPKFEYLNTTVQAIQDNPDEGLGSTSEGVFGAKWVFSSIFNESEEKRQLSRSCIFVSISKDGLSKPMYLFSIPVFSTCLIFGRPNQELCVFFM